MEKELRTLTIDPEFRDLIPPLTDEERELLETSILKEGCESPLIVWNTVIVDGHNRYEICRKHSIPFAVTEKGFESRESVLLWIITNQLGRRNLSLYQRGELVMKFEPLLSAKAKERQGQRTDLNNIRPNLGEGSAEVTTERALAKMAGVAHGTIHKVKKLSVAADDEIKRKLRRGEVSINKAYTQLMHKEHADEQKTCERCGEEKPVSDFDIPSNRHGFSSLCRACEKEIAEASKQAADVAKQTTGSMATSPISSIGMHKGHPIHVGAPFPDKPEMFEYLEEHVRLITDNFVAGAANAMRMYTPGMASSENTRTLREILKTACGAVRAFDEYVKEMTDHE